MPRDCLYCGGDLDEKMSWGAFFQRDTRLLCDECDRGLVRMEDGCPGCSRTGMDGGLCSDCMEWNRKPEWNGVLERNVSLFQYNEFMKEVLARYKYRGDYVLAKALASFMQTAIPKADLFVPIPLSPERLYERGFNQSKALLIEAGLPFHDLLTRTHTEKQSKKSRRERMTGAQVFRLPETDLSGQKILLIDDIYTTGTTVRHAATLLKKAGAREVSSFTIARG
ncbi:ComF family protein [Rossellomorea marisflavi]|uniref:ComF family protein n=1 Tax=Rossellomorea marisflavi TaxID=189381 RepID=UPI00296EC081|nr:ComF family protein [Rossellomorea marisflavi]MDW4528214.1 ComF family protein [Rossellomorea marisflavi]